MLSVHSVLYIENGDFWVLSSKQTKTFEKIVIAACLLHNIILEEEGLCLDDFSEQIEPMLNN